MSLGACLGPMQEMGMNYKHHDTIDCWKYALEAIINWLLLYFLVHDNRLLSMLEMVMNLKHQGTADCRHNIEMPGF